MGLVAREPQPSEFQIRHVQTSKLPIIDKLQAGLSCRRPCSALSRGLGPSFWFKQWVDRCPGYTEARRCGVFREITGAVGGVPCLSCSGTQKAKGDPGRRPFSHVHTGPGTCYKQHLFKTLFPTGSSGGWYVGEVLGLYRCARSGCLIQLLKGF